MVLRHAEEVISDFIVGLGKREMNSQLERNDISNLGIDTTKNCSGTSLFLVWGEENAPSGLEEEAGVLSDSDNESLGEDGRQGRGQENESSRGRESHFA